MTHHPIYEIYLNEMKRLGATPPYMSEAQVIESAGIEIEEEEVHIPFVARQSATGKCIEPSLHNHEQPKKLSKPPVMVNLLDIPKIQAKLEEFSRNDFVSVDDYYDALEAQKMVSIIRKTI
jgi:hypothetical protein